MTDVSLSDAAFTDNEPAAKRRGIRLQKWATAWSFQMHVSRRCCHISRLAT